MLHIIIKSRFVQILILFCVNFHFFLLGSKCNLDCASKTISYSSKVRCNLVHNVDTYWAAFLRLWLTSHRPENLFLGSNCNSIQGHNHSCCNIHDLWHPMNPIQGPTLHSAQLRCLRRRSEPRSTKSRWWSRWRWRHSRMSPKSLASLEHRL